MNVTEQMVAQVVAEVSSGADDPQHVSSLVGALMKRQPTVGHYVAAHVDELSLEGVVLTLLHAAVLVRCIELGEGRTLRPATAAELDAASGSGLAALERDEPELASYLRGNVSDPDTTLRGKRRTLALELLAVIAHAFLNQR